MDNKAIEAAARAMYERFAKANGNDRPNWGKATPRARESFIADAQAAIDAWRDAGGKMADTAIQPDADAAIESVMNAEFYELPATYSEVCRYMRAAIDAYLAASGDGEDAARYRKVRDKVCIVSGDGAAEFRLLNIWPTYCAPDAAIEFDAAIDAARANSEAARG